MHTAIKSTLEKAGFEVVDGFKKADGDEGNVLNRVLSQLRASTVYVGLLTKDIEIRDDTGHRWSPGVWVMEEKGMALGMGKPFVLVVHKDIHEDFWRKTAPHRIHVFFDDSDAYKHTREIVEAVQEHYQRVVLGAP